MTKYVIQLEVDVDATDVDVDTATRKLISKTLSEIGKVIVVSKEVPEYYGEVGDYE